MIARYRPVTYEDLPAIKRALRRVDEPFRASELVPHLPEVLRDLEPREIGRALLYRGLAERAGDHQLRRRHVSNDQGGRAAEVPGLSERPHHPQAAGQAILHGLLGGVDGGHRDPTASAAGKGTEILGDMRMTTETEPTSESQMCAACANLNSALCDDVCHGKSEWKSKQKNRKKPEDAPKAPAVHEDGTIIGTINNPEALDALEKCKHHGEKVDVNEEGVTFCSECGLAAPTNPVPEEESRKCSDCNDINSAERCIYCDGDPNEDRAGDKFIPEDRLNSVEPEEETPAGICIDADGNQVVVDPYFLAPLEEDCKGCIHLGDETRAGCQGCEPAGDEAGNPTHYEPAPIASEDDETQHALVPVDVTNEPWWRGGPLDTVDGMPWHTAVLKCPAGRSCLLLPGDYNYSGVKATNIGSLHTGGPMDPDTVIQHMLLAAEQDAKAEDVTEYKPGHNGQSTLEGEPLVRGCIERNPVVQVCVTVDKFLLRTTEEGLERAMDKEPGELEQWIYRKMRPLGKETVIGKDDWAEGMRQLRTVIEGAD